jgi:hypothetical protein
VYGIPRGFRAVVLVPFVLLAAGCGGSDGDPTDPGGQTPTISNVQLSVSSLPVTAGSSGEVTVTVARGGGFSGAVNVAADVPAGVTAQAVTIGSTATQGTLTFQVASGTAAGTLSATIRVTGTGVQEVTRPLSIVVTAPAAQDFTLSLNPTSVEFTQGGNASTAVTINRTGGFTGPVALSVEGLPQGVSAAFDPDPATGNSSTLSLSSTAGAAVGAVSLTVRGEATGIAAKTASLGLTVAATGGGGGTGNVTWAFCDETGIPVWVAAQDGNGPWTQVQGDAQNVFRFQIDSPRGGLAFVTVEDGVSQTLVFYYSREEFLAIGADQCDGLGGTKTVNGSVTGLGLTDMAFVALGSSSAQVVGAQGSTFSLNNVVDGPQDLIAARVALDLGTFNLVNDRLVLRRGINPADNSTLPAIDFAAEGFAPASAEVTVNGLGGGEQATVTGMFFSPRGAMGAFSVSLQPGSSHTYTGLPVDRLEAGEMHYLQISGVDLSQGAGEQPPNTRQVGLAFREVVDRTATLGPQLSAPTVTTVATAPSARFRAQWPLQPEYNKFVFAVSRSTGPAPDRGGPLRSGPRTGSWPV